MNKSINNWTPRITEDSVLRENLGCVCEKYRQPAIACALVNSREIITMAVAGTAMYGQEVPVDMNSRFHIGSTTKSMTALLIQMLVDEGRISFETTLEQAFPDLPMRSEYRNVTISELLLNKAGIMALQRSDTEAPAVMQKIWYDIPAACSDAQEQRREIAVYALSLAPINEPGTKAVYSNIGWAIAGHIIEVAAGTPYEEVLQERIFMPLGMENARVGGWPASPAEPEQPRGHYAIVNGFPKPQELSDTYTFPDWMNPAGGVHCTITDYALYIMENLAGLQGRGKLLDRKGYENIHTIHVMAELRDMYSYSPQMSQQEGTVSLGYGWSITTFLGSNLSTADGSGGTFYATMAVYPALDIAFAGFTNCGDGSPALQEIIQIITGLEDAPETAVTAGITATSMIRLEQKAVAWVELLVTEKFDQAADHFDKNFAKQFSTVQMQETWKSLIDQVGVFKGIKSTFAGNKDGYDYITITCDFHSASIDILVIYNSEGKISGLNIVPDN